MSRKKYNEWFDLNEVVAITVKDDDTYFSSDGCDTNPYLGNNVYDCEFRDKSGNTYECELSQGAISYFMSGQ